MCFVCPALGREAVRTTNPCGACHKCQQVVRERRHTTQMWGRFYAMILSRRKEAEQVKRRIRVKEDKKIISAVSTMRAEREIIHLDQFALANPEMFEDIAFLAPESFMPKDKADGAKETYDIAPPKTIVAKFQRDVDTRQRFLDANAQRHADADAQRPADAEAQRPAIARASARPANADASMRDVSVQDEVNDLLADQYSRLGSHRATAQSPPPLEGYED